MFSLELPHRGDSNENTRYTLFNMNKMNTLNYPKSAAMGFFQGTQERIRNSRGKRAINVRAIEVLLFVKYANIFVARNVRSFCSAKTSLIFFNKKFSVFGYNVLQHLTS